jgi:hypothetical protein
MTGASRRAYSRRPRRAQAAGEDPYGQAEGGEGPYGQADGGGVANAPPRPQILLRLGRIRMTAASIGQKETRQILRPPPVPSPPLSTQDDSGGPYGWRVLGAHGGPPLRAEAAREHHRCQADDGSRREYPEGEADDEAGGGAVAVLFGGRAVGVAAV